MTRAVATGPVPVSLRPASVPLHTRHAIREMQNVGAAGRIWYALPGDPPADADELAAFLAALPGGAAHFLDPGERAQNVTGGAIYAWSDGPERLVISDEL